MKNMQRLFFKILLLCQNFPTPEKFENGDFGPGEGGGDAVGKPV